MKLNKSIFDQIESWSEKRRLQLLADVLQREAEYGDHSDALRGTLVDTMHRIRMEKL